ncbi:hypothetical protein M2360_002135 [Rhizobium sp. SG_E_25_P2]|uniref:ABA4-like family protein n=1 Tax=Rhizobium sp. SG_E_25_P2 TaxID=2879942 RepID=UPI002475BB8F|nr:ABA4-like family protein [Rhizobium sp. SG_E_25_P2]MDH6266739.1 hypothetical protein [Rhizobium sp. SG_E_25_P2]
MNFDSVFSLASGAAMAGWLVLTLAPRAAIVMTALRLGLIGGLSLVYALLIFVYFFRIEGGGFGSIGEVRALFLSDAGLTAGWVHYLAFDLFVGQWIAMEADRLGWSRIFQAPLLVATFMFGPIGLLFFLIIRQTDIVAGAILDKGTRS